MIHKAILSMNNKFKIMKRILSITLLFSGLTFIYAQETNPSKDTTIIKKDTTANKNTNTDLNQSKKTISPSDTSFEDAGVSVSPSSFHLFIKPGTSVTKEIKVKNATKKLYKFNVGFNDFMMNSYGKPTMVKGDTAKYALSKYINLSPTYFELKPQQEIKIKMVISIPDAPEGYVSKWTIITIEQVADRPKIEEPTNPQSLALGIIPTFGFGVYVYQSPPNAKINKLEIQKFYFETTKDNKKKLKFIVKNIGDGISYCKSYAEIVNLSTGEQQKLNPKMFTILPGAIREFDYELPATLKPGKYSAAGIIDFGSNEEILAAELELEIQ